MRFQPRLSENVRLAIILCLSLFIHLAIIYGITWSPLGAEHSGSSAMPSPHRLTVSLSPYTHVYPARQSADAKKTAAIPDVKTETHANPDGNLSSMKMTLSTSLTSRYFSLSELDQHPVILRNISDNPPELRDYPQGGKVVFRLWIDKTGKVVNVDTLSSNLPQVFVDNSRNSFLNAKFFPGQKMGKAVSTVMDVMVSYAPIK